MLAAMFLAVLFVFAFFGVFNMMLIGLVSGRFFGVF